MGLFGLITDVASAAVKVARSPVALTADIVNKVLTGDNPKATEELLESAGEDLEDAVDEIIP